MTLDEINTYTPGDSVKLRGEFEVDDVDTDPTAPTFTVRDPDGTTTVYVYGTDGNVTKLATGIYQCVVNPVADGDWRWKVSGTGAAKAAEQWLFRVERDYTA